MRKLIFITVFLFVFLGYSQSGGPKVNLVKFVGETTTTERDLMDVPVGEHWLIWNATTSQFEHSGSDDVWSSLASSDLSTTDIDTFSELDAIVADEILLNASNVATTSTLNTSGFGGNLTATDDTLQEIADALDDITAGANVISKTATNQFIDIKSNTGSYWDLIFYNNSTPSTTGYLRSFGLGDISLYGDNGSTLKTYITVEPLRTTINASDYSTTETFQFDMTYDDATDVARKENVDDAVTIDASGFSNNLATTDDTLQELASAVDGLPTVQDGDKGDITVSASGATWSIDNDVIDKTNLADDDWGDISISAGVASIDLASVTGDMIQNETITGSDIANSTITSTKLDLTDDFDWTGIHSFGGVVDLENDGTYWGVQDGISGQRWRLSQSGGSATFGYQSAAGTSYVGTYTDLYTLNNTGTPSATTDLIDKAYADANYGNGDADQTLSLSGTGNKDLTISGTGGNTIDLTGVDGIDTDNIVSKGTARTSPTQYTDIYGQTQANYNTDGAPSAGELVIITDASPAEVVTSATVAMDGWKMYDDQTADAATITLSDCDPGETLTVYINRASAPTLAGTGLTFNPLPNTTAFAAATQMMMIFEVAYDGTTIDYYYVER